MNFVMNLPSNKRDKVVYDSILVIVDKCTKMIKYLLIIIKIDVIKLTNMFFKKIVLHFDMSTDIVNNKNFLFINIFWSTLYYHAKIKHQLNIVFHF